GGVLRRDPPACRAKSRTCRAEGHSWSNLSFAHLCKCNRWRDRIPSGPLRVSLFPPLILSDAPAGCSDLAAAHESQNIHLVTWETKFRTVGPAPSSRTPRPLPPRRVWILLSRYTVPISLRVYRANSAG